MIELEKVELNVVSGGGGNCGRNYDIINYHELKIDKSSMWWLTVPHHRLGGIPESERSEDETSIFYKFRLKEGIC